MAAPRELTAAESRLWPFQIFGARPLSLQQWRLSAHHLASQGTPFLSARRDARALYLKVCKADLDGFGLCSTQKEMRAVLILWDHLRMKHNVVAHFASLPNKASFTAAIRRDHDLITQLSPRLVIPLPTMHEVALTIPQAGMSVRELMLVFAPRLSIKTIAAFVEQVFNISAMEPLSKRLLPVLSFKQASELPKSRFRDRMIQIARLCQPKKTFGKPKEINGDDVEFHHLEGYYRDEARRIKICRKGWPKQLWLCKSYTEDGRDLKALDLMLEEVDQPRRMEVGSAAEMYVAQEKEVEAEKAREGSLIGRSRAVLGKRRLTDDDNDEIVRKKTKL